jgi:CheY-like chemotaxis protein
MDHCATHRAFRERLNHELRTRLNAIIGFGELLTLQPENMAARQTRDVQQILKSAREMLMIITRDLGEADEAELLSEQVPATAHCDILYIEDDEVNFGLVARILELRGPLKLQRAATGHEGLRLARAARPRLILLDLNLPDISGAEVLERLQEDDATVEVPVVVLSANATPSHIERLLTAGARNYLTKPFDIDPFLAVVGEFVPAEAKL